MTKSNNIDFSKAPSDATHFVVPLNDYVDWYKVDNFSVCIWIVTFKGEGYWSSPMLPLPADAKSIKEYLFNLEEIELEKLSQDTGLYFSKIMEGLGEILRKIDKNSEENHVKIPENPTKIPENSGKSLGNPEKIQEKLKEILAAARQCVNVSVEYTTCNPDKLGSAFCGLFPVINRVTKECYFVGWPRYYEVGEVVSEISWGGPMNIKTTVKFYDCPSAFLKLVTLAMDSEMTQLDIVKAFG